MYGGVRPTASPRTVAGTSLGPEMTQPDCRPPCSPVSLPPSAAARYRELAAGLGHRLTLILINDGRETALTGSTSSGSPPGSPETDEGVAANRSVNRYVDVCELLRHWQSEAPVPVRLVRLTPQDNCPAVFLDHLEAAVAGMVGIKTDRNSAAEERLIDLVNGLLAVPGELALVLIGFEVLKPELVQGLLASLVDDVPPGAHLYLVGSGAPRLTNLARLRVRRQLLELDWRLGDRRTPSLRPGHSSSEREPDSLARRRR